MGLKICAAGVIISELPIYYTQVYSDAGVSNLLYCSYKKVQHPQFCIVHQVYACIVKSIPITIRV